MSKKVPKRPNKAKSIVAQPLFRCRQEQPKKGKGSYRREASHWEASCILALAKLRLSLRPLHTGLPQGF